MDLVDLNGMWPSLKDIGEGIKSAANSVGEFVSDHKDTIATVATVAVAATVIVGCVITAPVAGAVIAGAAVGGTIGGISEITSQITSDGKVTSIKKVIISTALGAASGALTGGTASTATSIVGNAALSAGGSVAKDVVSIGNGANISGKDMVINAAINGGIWEILYRLYCKSYAKRIWILFNTQCHLVSNQDMLDLLLDRALVMLLLP